MKARRTMRLALTAAALATLVASAAAQAAAEGADAGATLASYPLSSFDGAKTKLSSYRGDIVVVNFWASWCSPCRGELAVMDKWNTEWAGRGARVVAISIDQDAKKAKRFADEAKLSLTVLHDGPSGLARSLDLPSLPCTYLLDRDGRVLRVIRSSSSKDLGALQRQVEELLASTRRVPQEAGMGSSSATIPGRSDQTPGDGGLR